MTDPARTGYADAAESWANDAMLAYGPLARHLVDACPVCLAGASALDAGAGTGAASAELRARGATVVAVDLQAGMLRRGEHASAAAVADVTALPFRAGSFDVVAAAFVLNHVADPAAALRSMNRVCRSGGAVLASSFAAQRAAAKNVIDDVAASYGWTPPAWYHEIRGRGERLSTVGQMIDAARGAGLVDIDVAETVVDVGLDDPAPVARYRLGMPQLAEFINCLPAHRRDALRADATAAVVASGETLQLTVVELVGRIS